MTALCYPDSLTDGVVRLRPWSELDIACVEQAGADSEIHEGTTVPHCFTPAEGLAFIRRQHRRLTDGEGVSLAVALEPEGRAVGLVYLGVRPQPGVIGIGYWIVPDARRQGFAARAVGLATGWALRGAGFARVEAWVEPDNHASKRVLEANVFAREGLLRSFLTIGTRRADALVYSRIAVGAEAIDGPSRRDS